MISAFSAVRGVIRQLKGNGADVSPCPEISIVIPEETDPIYPHVRPEVGLDGLSVHVHVRLKVECPDKVHGVDVLAVELL